MSDVVKLYKLDSKGKLRYWFATAVNGFVTTGSGIVGKEATSQIQEQYEAQEKNAGKKNYRTRVQQAVFEVEALYEAKIKKKGYQRTISSAESHVPDGVQLAHDYIKKNNHKKIKWGAVDGQVKLDGVRCRIVLDRQGGVLRVWSRQNEHYVLPINLYNDVLALFKDNPELSSLDGEIYIHGVDMADIQSMVTNDEHTDRSKLELWVYDTIEPQKTWLERKALIDGIEDFKYGNIHVVGSNNLSSIADAERFLEYAVGQGYEGIILRNHSGLYLCGKRSYDLQKWKLFQDDEFEMVDIEIDKRGHAVGVYVTNAGKRFNARWKAPDAKRKAMAEKPEAYLKKLWTIRFQKYSQDGIPIFPVAIAIRSDV